MSFWSDPSASFEQLGKDPWHSMENFATTGLVPMIPYIAGAVGGFFGGPAGAAAAGSVAQEGVDYFGGNSEARTGKGIQKSLVGGLGKGMAGYGAMNMGAGAFGDGGLFGSAGGETSINPATDLPWSDTGSGLAGNGSQITPTDASNSGSGFNFGDLTSYTSKLSNLLKLGNSDNSTSSDTTDNSLNFNDTSNVGGFYQPKPIKISPYSIHTQPAFIPVAQQLPVQNDDDLKLLKLAQILRGENG